jgi:dTDP-4-dehydrorhamnose reductase
VSDRRILITGGGGQLGSELEALLRPRAEVLAPSRVALDVTDDAALDAVFSTMRPTEVYNCAAFHNVEVCEREEDRAFEVNARAVKHLATRCDAIGAKLVHLSTNYVFDGTAASPYHEAAPPSPRSVYAISKLAGERAALAYAADSLVVRTAGLYGLHGSASKGGNFVTRMLDRAREHGELAVVADQRLTPTFTADLARGIVAAVDGGVSGTLHLTNAGETTWHGFTQAIMAFTAVDVHVEPVATTRQPGAAERPLNGVLASSVAPRAGLVALRPWKAALADYLERAGLRATAVPA